MNLIELLQNIQSGQNLAAVAQQLIQDLRGKNTESFEQIFGLIEDRIIYGDDDLREKIIVELLENLKNFSAWEDLDSAVFEPWLGAESHVAWRWLEKKFRGKSLEQATRQKDQ
jgi:hypothetical protein